MDKVYRLCLGMHAVTRSAARQRVSLEKPLLLTQPPFSKSSTTQFASQKFLDSMPQPLFDPALPELSYAEPVDYILNVRALPLLL